MKRVLIISYYWPPSGGSGVQRWVKFSRYLPDHDWQPVICTPENPELIARDTTLEAEIPACVEVLRRPIFEPYNLYRKLTGKGKDNGQEKGTGTGKEEVNPINAQHKSFGQKLSMFVRGNFFIPDPRCMWIRPTSKWLVRYLKEHPVDVIVSTGPPHSMHLIARRVAKKTGLPWIADFRDPWTRMFYFKHLNLSAWAEKKHHRLEQRVLNEATLVVAVSPLVQQEFRQMTLTPVELITNGYDEEDFKKARKALSAKKLQANGDRQGKTGNEKFRITHTGLFAADGNPETLWKVLAERCKKDPDFAAALEIRLVGKTDREILQSLEEAGLKDKTIDLGYCDHQTAVEEQLSASLLILPLRKEPEYKATLPGKLFEYLASGRPVLGIGQKDGAMAQILRETATGETWDWDEEEQLRTAVLQRWEAHKAGEKDIGAQGIEKYSRRATAAQMARLLDIMAQKEQK